MSMFNSTTSTTSRYQKFSHVDLAKRICFQQVGATKKVDGKRVPIVGDNGAQLFRVYLGVVETQLLSVAEKAAAVEFIAALPGERRKTFEVTQHEVERGWYFVGDSWGEPDPKKLEEICTGLRRAIEAVSAKPATVSQFSIFSKAAEVPAMEPVKVKTLTF